jgi:DNA repair exonuclease SbcCD nuclease subunit
MKILIVGDLHFRLNLPYSSLFDDGRKGEWEKVKTTIQALSYSADHVVFVGDIFNLRHNNSAVIRECVEFFKGMSQIPLHIISGNHDLFGTQTSIDFMQKLDIPNWNIYTKPTTIEIKDTPRARKTVTFLPYMTPGLLGSEDLETAQKDIYTTCTGGDYLFHHHAVSGTQSGGQTVDTWPEIVLDRKIIETKYSRIFGGHIHTLQNISDKTTVTGSAFTQEMGEDGKRVFMFNTEDGKTEEIPLPCRGLYQVFGIEELKHIPDNSIVRCIVKDRDQEVEKALERFDASIIVEQKKGRREQIEIRESEGLDLSISNLMKLYSEAKKIPLNKLTEGLELLENYV